MGVVIRCGDAAGLGQQQKTGATVKGSPYAVIGHALAERATPAATRHVSHHCRLRVRLVLPPPASSPFVSGSLPHPPPPTVGPPSPRAPSNQSYPIPKKQKQSLHTCARDVCLNHTYNNNMISMCHVR
jgi:hypothetical protein